MQEQLKNIAERLKKIHDWTETHLYEMKLKNITENMNVCNSITRQSEIAIVVQKFIGHISERGFN